MTAPEIVIDGGLVWSGPGEQHVGGRVHVRGGAVVYAGPPTDEEPPAGAVHLDATGCTVLPGLVDAHVHLTTNSDHDHVVASDAFRGQVSPQAKLLHGVRNAHRALAAGFTTLRVMGHRGAGEIELRDAIEQGLAVGPRLVVSPWWITMTNGHGDLFYPPYTPRQQWDTADGIEECRKLVRLHAKAGGNFIKVMASGGMSHGEQPHWPNYSPDELAVIVETAHELDMRVAAHAVSVDSIEHGSYLDADLAAEMSERGTFLVPTMAFNDWCRREGTQRGLTPEAVADLADAHDRTIESFALARSAGVRIVLGTDSSGTLCPFGAHARELELYVEHGMSTDEALATATTHAAALLDLPDIGSLRTGSAGDVVVVEGDVLADISAVARRSGIRHVVRAGRDVTPLLRSTSDTLDLGDENGSSGT